MRGQLLRALEEFEEQIVARQRRELGLVEPDERGLRHELPAHEPRDAPGIGESEGVDAIISAVGEAVGHHRLAHEIEESLGFGMRREIGAHQGRIGLAGCGNGLAGLLERDEGCGIGDGKDRHLIHRHAPLLAVGQAQQQRHRMERRHIVAGEGIARVDREAADDRDDARLERPRRGEGAARAIALEAPCEADALRMGTPIARETAAIIGERSCRVAAAHAPRADPSGRPCEGRDEKQHGGSDESDWSERAFGCSHARSRPAIRARMVRALPAEQFAIRRTISITLEYEGRPAAGSVRRRWRLPRPARHSPE